MHAGLMRMLLLEEGEVAYDADDGGCRSFLPSSVPSIIKVTTLPWRHMKATWEGALA